MKASRLSKNEREFEQDFERQSGRKLLNSSKSITAKATSFLKTKNGKIAIALAVIGFLAVAGGLAGGMYYAGLQNAPILSSTLTPLLAEADRTIESTILTPQEKLNLIRLTNFRSFRLLYRATEDGFGSHTFHRLCDNVIGTLTIYRTNFNSVFGGFTTAIWNSASAYRGDSNAFIVSLRRRGFINNERFNVTAPSNAIYTQTNFFPTFGGGHDINFRDQCDVLLGSYTNLCHSYQCPISSSNNQQYLPGITSNFLCTEIEVYQVNL